MIFTFKSTASTIEILFFCACISFCHKNELNLSWIIFYFVQGLSLRTSQKGSFRVSFSPSANSRRRSSWGQCRGIIFGHYNKMAWLIKLPVAYRELRDRITINVPLFKKLRDIIFFGGTITLWAISRDILRGQDFFDPLNCPSLRSGQFKVS